MPGYMAKLEHMVFWAMGQTLLFGTNTLIQFHIQQLIQLLFQDLFHSNKINCLLQQIVSLSVVAALSTMKVKTPLLYQQTMLMVKLMQ